MQERTRKTLMWSMSCCLLACSALLLWYFSDSARKDAAFFPSSPPPPRKAADAAVDLQRLNFPTSAVSTSSVSSSPLPLRGSARPLFDFESGAEFYEKPYPHFVKYNALDPSLFELLDREYPPIPRRIGDRYNPTGHKSIPDGSSLFRKVTKESLAWAKLLNFAHSQEFVDLGVRLFGKYFKEEARCLVEPEKLVYKYHSEDNSSVNLTDLVAIRNRIKTGQEKVVSRNEVFSRMDFFHGRPIKYVFPPHRDYPHRLFAILLYFDALNETTGGSLSIMEERGPGEYSLVRKIYPAPNLAVFMASGLPHSVHSADQYVGPGLRRMVHFQVSADYSVCRDDIDSYQVKEED
ncbi:hypothetical protein QOT17_007479 [Balamuthia mandrillaris]